MSESTGGAKNRRQYIENVEAQTIEKQLKWARVGYEEGPFTLFCDEPPAAGGDYLAPAPLMYFTSGLAL